MKCFFRLLLISLFLIPSFSYAVQESRPSPSDARLRVITYNPNAIHKYTGYYGYQASILLEDGEEVKTLSMGDSSAWQIVPSGSRIFIKPISDNPNEATTNMLLVTNKRIYHFILDANEVDPEKGINDPNLVFETKFLYPESGSSAVQQFNNRKGPDLSEPEKYNFNYTISGASDIAPMRVFDDKEFTYFQFTNKNADIPAFFLVDSDGKEALINYRVEGDYIVIERVTSQFTLRHGQDITCVFNESWPLKRNDKNKKKKRKLG
jgi:type IV secretion system protein VirB9